MKEGWHHHDYFQKIFVNCNVKRRKIAKVPVIFTSLSIVMTKLIPKSYKKTAEIRILKRFGKITLNLKIRIESCTGIV